MDTGMKLFNMILSEPILHETDLPAKNDQWRAIGTHEEWQERKRKVLESLQPDLAEWEAQFHLQLEKDKLDIRMNLLSDNAELEAMPFRRSSIPTPAIAVTPTATKTLSPTASPTLQHPLPPNTTKEVGDIFVDNNTGETYIWEGDIFRQIASNDFDINDYELVEDIKDILISPPKTDKDLECRDGLCMPPNEWKEVDDAISRTKLAEEKDINENTHPTVLTWLIRYLKIEDIENVIVMLEAYRRRDLISLGATSLKHSFDILELTGAPVFPDWFKRYKGVEEPPFIGTLVDPIIQ